MLQSEQINALCEQLNLPTVSTEWPDIAERCIQLESSHADFIIQLLQAELQSKQERTRNTLLRLAGFPSIKTLSQFDYKFATGISRKTVDNLSSLTFIERNENLILLGPSGTGKTHLANHFKNITIIHISPYSLELNPIEQA